MTVWTPADPDFAVRIEKYANSPVMKDFLGLRVLDAQPGFVTTAVDIRPELGHRPGWFEGGVTSMLGQMAAAWSCGTLAPKDSILLTLEKSTKFVGAAQGERLVAYGRVINHGRAISFGSAEVFAVTGSDEIMCATVALTCRLTCPK
jgi:acyl-coenzyme A thioesterase PaaI-like protein